MKSNGNETEQIPWEPFNPGMSEAAWLKFHKIMARLNIKYGPKIEKKRREQAEKEAAR